LVCGKETGKGAGVDREGCFGPDRRSCLFSAARLRWGEIRDAELWLAFRVFSLGEEFPLLEAFTRRGYFVCSTQQKAYGTNRVFWIKFTKDPAVCTAP
jgi:hypothetical protein